MYDDALKICRVEELSGVNSAKIGVERFDDLPQPTGVANYASRLLSAAIPLLPQFEFRVYDAGSWATLNKGQRAKSRLSIAQDSNLRAYLRKVSVVRAVYSALRTALFSRSVRKAGLSFFHALNFRPPDFGVPFLPVIHDLSYKRFPNFHPAERLRWLDALDNRIGHGSVVQTVSEFSACEIESYFGIPRSDIAVIYPMVSDLYIRHIPNASTLGLFGLADRSYFLSVCTMEPRKNLKTLVDAYSMLPLVIRRRVPLVLVGAGGWGELGFTVAANRLEREGSLLRLGFLPEAILADLYAHSLALCYSSLYEGFGMPVAEALCFDCPLILSDIPSLREASFGRGDFVHPLDVDAWRATLLAAAEGGPITSAHPNGVALVQSRQEVASVSTALGNLYLRMLEKV